MTTLTLTNPTLLIIILELSVPISLRPMTNDAENKREGGVELLVNVIVSSQDCFRSPYGAPAKLS